MMIPKGMLEGLVVVGVVVEGDIGGDSNVVVRNFGGGSFRNCGGGRRFGGWNASVLVIERAWSGFCNGMKKVEVMVVGGMKISNARTSSLLLMLFLVL